MSGSGWFGVRTIYEHRSLKEGRDRLYEERIVLIRANSPQGALEKAEAEAESYAVGLADGGVKYLGFVSGFEIYDSIAEGAEVFSLMRNSRLDPKTYIDRYFDTGRERERRWMPES